MREAAPYAEQRDGHKLPRSTQARLARLRVQANDVREWDRGRR
jgi:hypothetical protein